MFKDYKIYVNYKSVEGSRWSSSKARLTSSISAKKLKQKEIDDKWKQIP